MSSYGLLMTKQKDVNRAMTASLCDNSAVDVGESIFSRGKQGSVVSGASVVEQLPSMTVTQLGESSFYGSIDPEQISKRIPHAALSDALVDVVKWDERRQRNSIYGKSLPTIKSSNKNDSTSFAKSSSTSGFPNKRSEFDDRTDDIDHHPWDHFKVPTARLKLLDILRPEHSYFRKWEQMKEKRDQQRGRLINNEFRNSLVRFMSSLTIESEKEARSDQKDYLKSKFLRKVSHEKHIRTKENIRQWKESNLVQKRENASKLQNALLIATTMSKGVLMEDVAKKNAYRATMVNHLAPCSSTIVKVPEKLEKRIKKAKTEEEFKEGLQARKVYREKVLSDRIAEYSNSKSRAKFRALLHTSKGMRDQLDTFADGDLEIGSSMSQEGSYSYIRSFSEDEERMCGRPRFFSDGSNEGNDEDER